MTTTRTRMTSGAFGTGLRETVVVSDDTAVEFRGFVIEVAEDLNMTDEEIDEQLSLLLNIRLEARRRREAGRFSFHPR